MTTEAVDSGATFAPFATPTHADIAAGIAQIEAELALVASTPAEEADAEDHEPWVLDHADDAWESKAAIGRSSFARRAHATPLLAAEEEVMLARRIEAGALAQERLDSGIELKRTQRRALEHVVREAEEARERMVLANVRLVTSIARKSLGRAGHGMTFDDVQQAGLIGLMRAVDKFDYTLGHKFSTYATWWIKQSISRTIDDEARVIRVPVHALDSARRIDTPRRRAGLAWSEAVTDPSQLGGEWTSEEVATARDHLRHCLSLDQVVEKVDIVDEDSAIDWVIDRASFTQWWADAAEHLAITPGRGPSPCSSCGTASPARHPRRWTRSVSASA